MVGDSLKASLEIARDVALIPSFLSFPHECTGSTNSAAFYLLLCSVLPEDPLF